MSVAPVLQSFGYIAATTLQLLIIRVMLRDSWRRYPILFLYVVLDLLTNVIEFGPRLIYYELSQAAKRQWAKLYYWDEWIIQAILFILVISLIYRASTDVGPRRLLLAGLVLGSLLFAGISLLIFYDSNLTMGKWMNPWARNMNFGAAILDMLLWATLIRTRQRDPRVLLISGGLGIHFTAAAIGWALREVSHGAIDIASILMISGNLACFYIWWQALRVPARTAPPPPILRAAPLGEK